ncbi:acireductone synthase [Methylocapsa palsarum]|uniref:Enolase-phosphatase E1 n=1 Tax=Methylocapsa palsarum TaxID=1612308 RepID=A0A1I4ASA0_9HYPH|nr:acireductone synthase [Methylocapsa palsarum]SFK58599.1 enolase-phosphatase E1 [Methylocapsa palsarum]
MAEPVRAVLTDLEGAALPASFVTQTLGLLARERLADYIGQHAADPDIEDALDEAGRLLGGFCLKPEEASALLLRWMKQDRKATPLKLIQGLIWREAYEAGSLTSELYADVADCLKAWASAGLRLFVYSSNSELAQKLLLSRTSSGDLTPLFEAFFDTTIGQKIEPASYRAISDRLALPCESILVLSSNEDELDAARTAGLATVKIAREEHADSRHPVCLDFASLKLG